MLMSFFAGLSAGILSGWGVGGGSLLLLYLTQVAGVAQRSAQGLNLLYFLACSAPALWGHWRRGLVEKRVFLPAVLGGSMAVIPAVILAGWVGDSLLRKAFGIFLLFVGLRELLRR